MNWRLVCLGIWVFSAQLLALQSVDPAEDVLAGTAQLEKIEDPAAEMVEGIHRFLDRQLAKSIRKREQHWDRDFSSWAAYESSVDANRARLARILGVVGERVDAPELLWMGGPRSAALVMETDRYQVFRVRWPVFAGVDGEGLLVEPFGGASAGIIVVPDADQTPEELLGLEEGDSGSDPFVLRLADQGCRVVVPVLLNRDSTWSGSPEVGYTDQSHREWIYRQAFQLGRHIIGFEIEKIQALLDWFEVDNAGVPAGIIGYGEGALLSFYTAALDRRVEAVLVSGYFSSRQKIWEEPIYRNIWAYLHEFGDAEVASLVAPRRLIVEYSLVPQEKSPPLSKDRRETRAPGKLTTPPQALVASEFERAQRFFPSSLPPDFHLVTSPDAGPISPFSSEALTLFSNKLNINLERGPANVVFREDVEDGFIRSRQRRQVAQLENYCQDLMLRSDRKRKAFWADAQLDGSPDQWEQAVESYRNYYHDEIIGKFSQPALPPNPRTRVLYRQPGWTAYEVKLDLWRDVFTYGILLVPNDLDGEKRPVVVAQHGLEGTPVDVVNPYENTRAYHSFGARLADLGFVVYAPQNPYRGKERFRMLNRKANPLKKTFFGVIVRQHQQVVDWLTRLPFVNAERIGFYGLSYGGVSAMRLPPLVPQYALSICSANFNDWVQKIGSTRLPLTYLYHHEFEMFGEFDVANRFNYSDLVRLIAPRPFMVERGHKDGAGTDPMVAAEYARVRQIYTKLGISDRTRIEFFNGGHEINLKGTLDFLKRFLDKEKSW